MALTKVIGNGLGSLGTGNLTHGSDSGDTRFTLNSANQYTMVLKNAGNISGQIGGGGADVLRFSNAAGATIMEMNAGQITKPLQPAFLATKTSNANNFTTGSQQDITFTTEVYDQNADFASSIFTAPVTGKYYLKSSIYLSGVDTAVDYYAIRINTSNRIYIKIFTPKFTADVDFMSMEVSTVADMDASDTAKIQIIQSSGATQTDIQGNAAYTFFTGYLVA